MTLSDKPPAFSCCKIIVFIFHVQGFVKKCSVLPLSSVVSTFAGSSGDFCCITIIDISKVQRHFSDFKIK